MIIKLMVGLLFTLSLCASDPSINFTRIPPAPVPHMKSPIRFISTTAALRPASIAPNSLSYIKVLRNIKLEVVKEEANLICLGLKLPTSPFPEDIRRKIVISEHILIMLEALKKTENFDRLCAMPHAQTMLKIVETSPHAKDTANAINGLEFLLISLDKKFATRTKETHDKLGFHIAKPALTRPQIPFRAATREDFYHLNSFLARSKAPKDRRSVDEFIVRYNSSLHSYLPQVLQHPDCRAELAHIESLAQTQAKTASGKTENIYTPFMHIYNPSSATFRTMMRLQPNLQSW